MRRLLPLLPALIDAAFTPAITPARVTIDLSFGDYMSRDERLSLARQLLRCYSNNLKHSSPVDLHFSGVGAAEASYPESLPEERFRERWQAISLHDEPAGDVWQASEMVWLSPDAEEPLEGPLDPNVVYVLGGIIDGSVDSDRSLSRARQCGAIVRRLPSDVHPILTLPACLDVLADVHGGATWEEAFLRMNNEAENIRRSFPVNKGRGAYDWATYVREHALPSPSAGSPAVSLSPALSPAPERGPHHLRRSFPVNKGRGAYDWATYVREHALPSPSAGSPALSPAPNMALTTDQRFGHLLEPIRDLAENWGIDKASELEEYLLELESITISFEDGDHLDFAEAALLIQGSQSTHSKKVEQLNTLVLSTLDAANKKRKENDKAGRGEGAGNHEVSYG